MPEFTCNFEEDLDPSGEFTVKAFDEESAAEKAVDDQQSQGDYMGEDDQRCVAVNGKWYTVTCWIDKRFSAVPQ